MTKPILQKYVDRWRVDIKENLMKFTTVTGMIDLNLLEEQGSRCIRNGGSEVVFLTDEEREFILNHIISTLEGLADATLGRVFNEQQRQMAEMLWDLRMKLD
jgi:hypothetical protein